MSTFRVFLSHVQNPLCQPNDLLGHCRISLPCGCGRLPSEVGCREGTFSHAAAERIFRRIRAEHSDVYR
jgi:hypothetical protein